MSLRREKKMLRLKRCLGPLLHHETVKYDKQKMEDNKQVMPTAPMLCWKPSSCIALYSVEFLLWLAVGLVVVGFLVTGFDDGGDGDRSWCRR